MIDETIERFGENQGVSDLPAFDNDNTDDQTNDGKSAEQQNEAGFRPSSADDYYPSQAIDSPNNADSYLTPLLNESNQPSRATAPPDVRLNDQNWRKPPRSTALHQQEDSYL